MGSVDEKDLAAHVALHRAGYKFTVLAEDARDGYSNIDLLIDGEKWEVKSPTSGNVRAVESNVRKAKDQFEKSYPEGLDYANIVFNSTGMGLDDESIETRLRDEMRKHCVTKGLLITKKGLVKKIK